MLNRYLQHGFGVWQLLALVDFDVSLRHKEKSDILDVEKPFKHLQSQKL